MTANFLTGPVSVSKGVRAAFSAPPMSHRGVDFVERITGVRASLTSLVNVSHVALMVGSGTLANDAVAAQIKCMARPGLILANGEFGERLIDHGRRWQLDFAIERRSWGGSFDWDDVLKVARRRMPSWIWAVATETSTGISNSLSELRAVCERVGAALCLDAVSAVGLMAMDLRDVRFATAVSGKGLAAYPGLAAVFHTGRLRNSKHIPRYLDLSLYEEENGVPFTHSSNLVAALGYSLAHTNWQRKFANVVEDSRWLNAELQRLPLQPLASKSDIATGILTFKIAEGISTADVAMDLAQRGLNIGWQSRYLLERNWMQVALMGEIERDGFGLLPIALAASVARRSAQRPNVKEGLATPSCSLSLS